MIPRVTEYTGHSGPRYSIKGYHPAALLEFLKDLSLPTCDVLDADGVSPTRIEVRVNKEILSSEALELIKEKMGKVREYDGYRHTRIYFEGYSIKTLEDLLVSLTIMDPTIFDVEDGTRSPWVYSITTRKTPAAIDALGHFVEQ